MSCDELKKYREIDVFLKMTVAERIEHVKAFSAMREALELPLASYERALATQAALKRVDRVRAMMAEARNR